jgi:hypothetical protein
VRGRRKSLGFPPPVPTGSASSLACKACLEGDGTVSAAAVVEHRCTNARTGKDFTAFVCARCLDAGRETRVTCRTFVPRR